MDIQHLVDRLEDLIDEGRHMPFSKFTMIDEERDRVLAQANEKRRAWCSKPAKRARRCSTRK
jgi:hypothetical protein